MIADGSRHGAVNPAMTTQLPPVGELLGDLANTSGGSAVADGIAVTYQVRQIGLFLKRQDIVLSSSHKKLIVLICKEQPWSNT